MVIVAHFKVSDTTVFPLFPRRSVDGSKANKVVTRILLITGSGFHGHPLILIFNLSDLSLL